MSRLRNDATVARASYFEFRNGDTHVFQLIMIPETKHPETGEVVLTCSMSRDLTKAHPRPTWKYTSAKEPYAPIDPNDPLVLADEAVHVLAPWKPVFVGLVNNGWTLVKHPLTFSLTEVDIKAIHRRDGATAMMRKLMNVRDKAGFSPNPVEGLRAVPDTKGASF